MLRMATTCFRTPRHAMLLLNGSGDPTSLECWWWRCYSMRSEGCHTIDPRIQEARSFGLPVKRLVCHQNPECTRERCPLFEARCMHCQLFDGVSGGPLVLAAFSKLRRPLKWLLAPEKPLWALEGRVWWSCRRFCGSLHCLGGL